MAQFLVSVACKMSLAILVHKWQCRWVHWLGIPSLHGMKNVPMTNWNKTASKIFKIIHQTLGNILQTLLSTSPPMSTDMHAIWPQFTQHLRVTKCFGISQRYVLRHTTCGQLAFNYTKKWRFSSKWQLVADYFKMPPVWLSSCVESVQENSWTTNKIGNMLWRIIWIHNGPHQWNY